jgi:hypothetical protein
MTLDELLSTIYNSNCEQITVRASVLRKGNPGGLADTATVTISLDGRGFVFERDDGTGTWTLLT